LSYDGDFISFESYDTTDHLCNHHYLNDCGMGDNNNNEHLIFLDKDTAEEYVQACRSDVEEIERYIQHIASCDEIDKYDDNDYDYESSTTNW
jgi:hypothetical protein